MKKKVLVLTLALSTVGSAAVASNYFTDVPSDAWYHTAVNALKDWGITSGYPDGTFKPENNITRGEVASMIYREHQANVEDIKTFLGR
ncbi:S-layer homology domain-containing protein [Effusibacillus consociatus]|uniref:S-layer homology domain-containing protein n=1 Tax=Effusibacillus consociatus TaxID=1117041 RepID=A0ABV9Q541_9BACL